MKYLLFLLLLAFFIGCTDQAKPQEPVVCKEKESPVIKECPKIEPCAVCPKVKPCKPTQCKPITIYKEYEKLIIGENEEVYLPALDISLDARIDTGATTTSVDARNIVSFERDGKQWVRFEIIKKDKSVVKVKRPVIRRIKVKRHNEEGQARYVVNMRLNISSLSHFIEVSLVDRSQFKFPVLIGRNFIKGNALVDVAVNYTKSPTKENK